MRRYIVFAALWMATTQQAGAPLTFFPMARIVTIQERIVLGALEAGVEPGLALPSTRNKSAQLESHQGLGLIPAKRYNGASARDLRSARYRRQYPSRNAFARDLDRPMRQCQGRSVRLCAWSLSN
jgi:hypothetical protein